MKFDIAVLPGDGIGAEITDGAVYVLKKIAKKFGHEFSFTYALIGGCAVDETGKALPKETIAVCKNSDSVLLGAVGGHKWDGLRAELRPETGLLGIRKELGLYANLRPAKIYDALLDASPLKESVCKGTDIMIVRELTGGIYFGERGEDDKGAYDTERYSAFEIERIARKAFQIASGRSKRVVSVDKANVLASSKLWRRVMEEIKKDYPDISLSHMYVDNAAMQLATAPSDFDVIVTSNMFGDILSDLAAASTGSIGMLASASLSDGCFGLYEPVHGSAPDIAGLDIANPIAAILSAAMMLKISFSLSDEAETVEKAVETVLRQGWRTKDISDGIDYVGCKKMISLIGEKI